MKAGVRYHLTQLRLTATECDRELISRLLLAHVVNGRRSETAFSFTSHFSFSEYST